MEYTSNLCNKLALQYFKEIHYCYERNQKKDNTKKCIDIVNAKYKPFKKNCKI